MLSDYYYYCILLFCYEGRITIVLVETEPILIQRRSSAFPDHVAHTSLPCTGTTVENSQTVVITSLCLLIFTLLWMVAATFSQSLGLWVVGSLGRWVFGSWASIRFSRILGATCNEPFPDERPNSSTLLSYVNLPLHSAYVFT